MIEWRKKENPKLIYIYIYIYIMIYGVPFKILICVFFSLLHQHWLFGLLYLMITMQERYPIDQSFNLHVPIFLDQSTYHAWEIIYLGLGNICTQVMKILPHPYLIPSGRSRQRTSCSWRCQRRLSGHPHSDYITLPVTSQSRGGQPVT